MGGVSIAVVLFGMTWQTYRVAAFGQPTFEGALARAPDVLDAIQREYHDLQGLGDRARVLARQLDELTQAAATGSTVPGSDVAILHISDIHLNPVGVEIAGQLASQFHAVAIVDTGDLTSYGLPVGIEDRGAHRHDTRALLLRAREP